MIKHNRVKEFSNVSLKVFRCQHVTHNMKKNLWKYLYSLLLVILLRSAPAKKAPAKKAAPKAAAVPPPPPGIACRVYPSISYGESCLGCQALKINSKDL